MKVPIEVVIKDEEIAIYIDRKLFLGWLRDVPGALDGESPVPWDGDSKDEKESIASEVKDENAGSGSDKAESEPQGFKTGDGTTKEFPNPVEKGDPNGEEVDPDAINLFDEGPNGIGGTLQEDGKAKEKMKAMRDWLKDEKFNYKNFCIYLYQLKEVAGFKLSTPLIGLTQKKEPSMFQLATRYYSFWLSAKDEIAGDYKTFLIAQLADMGSTIQMVKDEFDGEEIDPKNLPKALAVTK